MSFVIDFPLVISNWYELDLEYSENALQITINGHEVFNKEIVIDFKERVDSLYISCHLRKDNDGYISQSHHFNSMVSKFRIIDLVRMNVVLDYNFHEVTTGAIDQSNNKLDPEIHGEPLSLSHYYWYRPYN